MSRRAAITTAAAAAAAVAVLGAPGAASADEGSSAGTRVLLFGNSAEARLRSLRFEGRVALGPRAALLAGAEGWTIAGGGAPARTGRADLGAWLRAGRTSLELVGGPRTATGRAVAWGGHAAVRTAPAPWASLEAAYSYEDIYRDFHQPASVASGARGHALYLSSYAEPARRLAVYVRGGGRALAADDRMEGSRMEENRMVEAVGWLQLRIAGPLRIGYLGQYQHWRVFAPSYYSPQFYATHYGLVRLADRLLGVEYDVSAMAGATGAEADGAFARSYGRAYALSGALKYRRGRVELRAESQYVASHRGAPYSSLLTTSSLVMHF